MVCIDTIGVWIGDGRAIEVERVSVCEREWAEREEEREGGGDGGKRGDGRQEGEREGEGWDEIEGR